MRLYIAVLDSVPDHMVPVLVAHTMLNAHVHFTNINSIQYKEWFDIFKKCVVKVNQKQFNKIAELNNTWLGHENKTLGGIKSCAIPEPCSDENLPKVLKFAPLWKPNCE